MTRLILVRHGQTDWNKQKRVQGKLDIPLNAEGKRQIQGIISALAHLKGVKGINAVYSSCLSRSWETAEAIGKVFGLKVKRLRELNELNQGAWEGLLEKQIVERHRKAYNIWKTNPLLTKPPKGESIEEAKAIALSAIKKIIGRHQGQTICVVTHEIISAIIKCHYMIIDMSEPWKHIPKNASLKVLEIQNG